MNLIKKRGVVLELIDSEMILLTTEGEFVRRPVLDNSVTIGQEICYAENVEHINKPKVGTQFLTRWRRSGLAVAVVLLLLVLTPALLNQMPMASETVAYVTIDVNPSIGLGIDNKNAVVSAEGLNQEGTDILESMDIVGKSSEDAVAAITEKVISLGFIKQDEAAQLMITVRPIKVSKNNKVVAKLEQSLCDTTKAVLAKDNVKYATVASALIDEELRISAQVAGISPGRYLMMLADNQQHNNAVALALDDVPAIAENTEDLELTPSKAGDSVNQTPAEQETPAVQKPTEQLAAAEGNIFEKPSNNTKPDNANQNEAGTNPSKPQEGKPGQDSLAAANLPTPVAEVAMFIDGELVAEDEDDDDEEESSDKDLEQELVTKPKENK